MLLIRKRNTHIAVTFKLWTADNQCISGSRPLLRDVITHQVLSKKNQKSAPRKKIKIIAILRLKMYYFIEYDKFTFNLLIGALKTLKGWETLLPNLLTTTKTKNNLIKICLLYNPSF